MQKFWDQCALKKSKEGLDVFHVNDEEAKVFIEKDKTNTQPTNEKLELAKEIEVFKSHFKTICSALGDVQLHDKDTLVNVLDKVTEINHDLNENIQELHGLLEQQKSNQPAAIIEFIPKLNEGKGVSSRDDSDPRSELESKLLNSRTLKGKMPSGKTKDLNVAHFVYDEVTIEKDQLRNEKSKLEREIEVLKGRFKKMCSFLEDAQLKDNDTLVKVLEKVQKINHDLNENIQQLHNLLKQEKSKPQMF